MNKIIKTFPKYGNVYHLQAKDKFVLKKLQGYQLFSFFALNCKLRYDIIHAIPIHGLRCKYPDL